MNILLIDKNHPILREGLEKLGCRCEEDFTSSKEIIEHRIANYEGIVIRSRFPIDKAFIDKATRLKFIARVGAGLENIAVEYAEKKGISVISSPEGNRNAVGEHALGMLLSLFNRIPQANAEIGQGKWQREANRGVELTGKTIGIIGYGNMGNSFAKKLQGFDVKEVICYDLLPNVGNSFARQVSLQELQEKTDILSLHTPHNKESYQMVNQRFIDKFTKPFYLINTARGTAVVTDDLVNSLKNGKILGACLDVIEYEQSSFENFFQNEPPKAFEYLINADNVLMSPHIAGWTQESKIGLAQVIVDKVEALFF
ncbi:MAG: 2-hydroxyacid dehydrogenase [Flavobacteriaceae bacterium]|nr:2-hydroxyacid dehydrogenase [Flavobacteriaceae bacterium]